MAEDRVGYHTAADRHSALVHLIIAALKIGSFRIQKFHVSEGHACQVNDHALFIVRLLLAAPAGRICMAAADEWCLHP